MYKSCSFTVCSFVKVIMMNETFVGHRVYTFCNNPKSNEKSPVGIFLLGLSKPVKHKRRYLEKCLKVFLRIMKVNQDYVCNHKHF